MSWGKWRGRASIAAVAIAVATALGGAVPAAAEDNDPTAPAGSCATPGGASVPEGTPVLQTPSTPSLPGSFGIPGMYICVGGQWQWIGYYPGGGGLSFATAGGAALTYDQAVVQVAEGGTASNAGTYSWSGSETLAFAASAGTIAASGGAWSWSQPALDGPATTNVMLSAGAGPHVGGAWFDVEVQNVAPMVVSVAPDRQTALVGEAVTFTGTATDPSAADTAAGFAWTFDGAPATTNAVTATFDTCGAHSVTATAADKDGGVSAAVTSAPVSVLEAAFAGSLADGSEVVRAGRVLPVRIEFACGGASAIGLTPQVQLFSGGAELATQSVSSADSGTTMRWNGEGYIYNLRVPPSAAGGTVTVRVRPFGGSPSALTAVLHVR